MQFITDKGSRQLHKWLSTHARGFEMHDYGEWVNHAKASAMISRYEITLDPAESTTGKRERLVLRRDWFFSK